MARGAARAVIPRVIALFVEREQATMAPAALRDEMAIDPQTGEQRIVSHPNDTKYGPHGHVNDINGNRIGPGGHNVPPESIPAHLPIRKR